jgi:hypothetical protein
MIMTLLKGAGIANPTAQLYMFFYYLGPALLLLTVIGDKSRPLPARSVACMICTEADVLVRYVAIL